MNQREKNRILWLYNRLSFPASFASVKKFKKSLLDNEGISITEYALKKILDKDLANKFSKVKPRNRNPEKKYRQIVADSVGVSAQVSISKLVLTLVEKVICSFYAGRHRIHTQYYPQNT